jgi:hypothetical protein
MPTHRLLAALPLLVVLASCAKDAPPPVTSFTGQDCPVGANRSAPLIPAELNKPGGGASSALFNSQFTAIDIRPDISCAEVGDYKATIAVVNLPAYVAPYRLTLSSAILRSGAVWSPDIEVQDEARKPLRTIPFDAFKQVGEEFVIEIYPKPNERFLFLSTNMIKLSKTGTYVATIPGTGPMIMPMGNGGFVPIAGTPDKQVRARYQFSHNGVLRAGIRYIDAKDVPPNAP